MYNLLYFMSKIKLLITQKKKKKNLKFYIIFIKKNSLLYLSVAGSCGKRVTGVASDSPPNYLG